MATIDMQKIRYLNLLGKVSGVQTRHCFVYNNMIVFAVPRALVSRAIGPGAKNIREMQETLGKKVKVISESNGLGDAQRFVKDIVEPVQFKSLEFKDDGFILTAGGSSKAALIGRNKRRLEELSEIIVDCYGKQLKIV